jgi:hypothetical protein
MAGGLFNAVAIRHEAKFETFALRSPPACKMRLDLKSSQPGIDTAFHARAICAARSVAD